MPTLRPRLMISVTPETLFDLETLALITRKPVATICAEVLSDMRPRMRAWAAELCPVMPDEEVRELVQGRIAASEAGKQGDHVSHAKRKAPSKK
jgi:hypothetical protein